MLFSVRRADANHLLARAPVDGRRGAFGESSPVFFRARERGDVRSAVSLPGGNGDEESGDRAGFLDLETSSPWRVLTFDRSAARAPAWLEKRPEMMMIRRGLAFGFVADRTSNASRRLRFHFGFLMMSGRFRSESVLGSPRVPEY